MLRLLQRLSAFLACYTAPFIIAVAVLSYFFPKSLSWVCGNVQAFLLGLIMLSMGMTLRREDFHILLQRPWDMLIGACAQYVLMPLLAYFLVQVFDLPREIAAGLILVGCCPGGVSSNIMSFLCKGDVAFSVGMTTISTLISPILTPLLVFVLAGESIDVDAGDMFNSIALVTLLPVCFGVFCNFHFSRSSFYHELCGIMPGVAVLGLGCIVGSVSAQHAHAFFVSGAFIFLCVFLHNGLGYLFGYITARLFHMSRPQRRTLSIEVGMQNAGLATVLASRHFPMMPEAALVSALACAWHSISGTLLAAFFTLWDNSREYNGDLRKKICDAADYGSNAEEDSFAEEEGADRPSEQKIASRL